MTAEPNPELRDINKRLFAFFELERKLEDDELDERAELARRRFYLLGELSGAA